MSVSHHAQPTVAGKLVMDASRRAEDSSVDERLNRVASMANQLAYGSKDAATYIDGAPHIKHAVLRELYGKLVLEVFDAASKHGRPPRVADLGAGEGSVTLPFLELGAHVVAVDISSKQLNTLREKCRKHEDKLDVRCQDIHEFLSNENDKYDIIAVNSFLHHIPDYLSLIADATSMLTPHGLFFSFQDPLRYDTVGIPTRIFTELGYFFWRLSKNDVMGGIRRRIRRSRGIYLEGSVQDNAEYHVVRNGLDQKAIETVFGQRGFNCRVIPYYSTHNSLFQPIGTALNLENHFAVVAQRSQQTTPESDKATSLL
ncbi:MAG: class I SAM-dependent methyltransferase [Pirellulales bacterium]|nr:class I SAM-dependent methyltransferase [Pirellulales bacterium]